MTVRDKTGTSGRGTPRVPPPPVSDEDWKVKVSGADTTPGFLNVKIPSTLNLSWTIGTPGGNEQWLGSVVGITEPSGSTVLPFGAIPAGSVLARVGGFVVGVPPVFTPTAHAPTHRPATGTDPLATAAPAQGIGGGNSTGVADSFARSDHDHTIRETGGLTDLTVGIIADGQAVVRSGTSLVGVNVAGGTYFWGAGNVATTAVTRFLQPGYQTGVAPTTGVRIPIRRAGTIRNLTMQNRVVGVGAAIITFTLLKNGVATALTFGVAATAASGSDAVNTVAVVAGDFIELRVTKAAVITTSPTDIEVAVDFGP